MAVNLHEQHRPREATVTVSIFPDVSGDFVCNGTNDGVEVQAAVTLAGTLNGNVYFLQGTYTEAAEVIINVPSNVVIEGSSDKTVTFDNMLFELASVSVDAGDVVFRNFRVTGDDIGAAIIVDADDCTISNILVENVEADTVVGASAGRRGIFCLRADNTSIIENVRFINCKALDCIDHGFKIEDDVGTGTNEVRDVWFIACESINSGKTVRFNDWITGFAIAEGDASFTTENIFVLSCKADGSWESGFHQEDLPTKTNCWFINCTSNNNGRDKGAPTFASGFLISGDTSVIGCKAYNNGFAGISLSLSSYTTLTGNICRGNGRQGILLVDTTYCNIEDNQCIENDSEDTGTYDGIYIGTGSDSNTVVGNTCRLNDRHGIFLGSNTLNMVTGNTLSENGDNGVRMDSATYCTVTGNSCDANVDEGINVVGTSSDITITGNTCSGSKSGMSFSAAVRCTVTGNTCSGNTQNGISFANIVGFSITGNTCTGNTRVGINLYNPLDSTITGNTCFQNVRDGMAVELGGNNTIAGNTCNENDVNDSGNYDGIKIFNDSDYNVVHSNTCNDNHRWGISIGVAANDCVGNWVKNNHLRGNTAGPFLDNGTDTKLATKTFQFIAGGDVEGTAIWASFVSATASAKGWSVTGADDWAVALSQLPLELQQIVRFKIWAVALGAPINAGGQMHLEIVMNAGADNLAFTTEPVALANFDGITTDYVNTDVIHWVVDSGDDADIGSMIGGMSLEVKVIYETGSDPDGATNAVFRTLEIEYV